MTKPPRKPDFYVDQYGNVRKADQQDFSKGFKTTPVYQHKSGALNSKATSGSKIKYYLIPIPIGLIVTLIVYLLSFTKSGRIDKHLEKGMNALNAGQFSQAITEFDEVLELTPEDGTTYLNRSYANLSQEKYQEAIADCNQAITLLSNPGRAYNNRGIAYASLGDHEQAIKDYTEAIDLLSNDIPAHFNRGLSYNSLGEFDLAISDFDIAIENTPESIFSQTNESDPMDFFRQDKISNPVLQTIYGDIDLPTMYLSRGLAFLGKFNIERGIADFDKAIELAPSLSEAYLFRGYAHYTQLDFEAASADFQKVIDLDNDPESERLAQTFLIELGR